MEKQKLRLGTVAFSPKGKWNAETEYKRLNVVHYLASSYYAKKDNVGQTPSLDSEYWGLLVEGGDVVNNPDEEDITTEVVNDEHVLKLADRDYRPDQFSGKGYKILRKNLKRINLAVTKITVKTIPTADGEISITINNVDTHVTIAKDTQNTTALVATAISEALVPEHEDYDVEVADNVVTLTRKHSGEVEASAFDVTTTGMTLDIEDSVKTVTINLITPVMVNKPNTIYEIRYDFDLDGGTLKLADGCILKFNGGSLRNGTIQGLNTIIEGDAKIFTETSGSFVGETHVKWFLQKRVTDYSYNAKDDIERAIKFASQIVRVNQNVLNFDNEYLYVKGSIHVGRGIYIFKNISIMYEPENAMESLFECSTPQIYWGQLSIIDAEFECKNPKKLQGINVIHFHKQWYNTANWYFKNIHWSKFTAYFLVNESYLQEGSFNNVTGEGNAFLTCNYPRKFGDSVGSCNVVTIQDCSVNNGYTWIDTDIVPYKNDLYSPGIMKFINCVWQGYSPKTIRSMRIRSNTANSVANEVLLDCFWNEDVNAEDDSLDLEFGAHVIFKGQSNFSHINIKAPSVCLDVQLCQVQTIKDFIKSINIDDGITDINIIINGWFLSHLSFKESEKLSYLMDNGIITTFSSNNNPWRQNEDPKIKIELIKKCNGIFSVVYETQFREYMNVFKYTDVDEIPVLQVYSENMENNHMAFLETSIQHEPNISHRSFGVLVVYRVAPLVDVTEENVNDVKISGLFDFEKFDVGTKAGTFSQWKKRIFTGSIPASTYHYDYNITPKGAMVQIAKFEAAETIAYLNDDIRIINNGANITFGKTNPGLTTLYVPVDSFSKHHKDIFQSEHLLYRIKNGDIYSYNKTTGKHINIVKDTNGSGTTAARPTDVSAGYEYFDTNLKKPIWWNGTSWVDKDGNPADSKLSGTTSERPTGVQIGYTFKDTTLDKLIIWNGAKWVNMDGSTL